MKAPSRNVSKSLAGQRTGGRGPESVETSMQKSGLSMEVPGEGKVQEAPGTNRNQGGDRSAQHYTGPMKKYGGG